MEHKIHCKWNEGMSFEAEVDGHKLVLDADESNGGKDLGPRPKKLLLAGLAGCTGMDVISILKKMRVDVKDFNMSVSGNTLEEHPKYYEKIHITYEFWGNDLPMAKIEKAISLSKERYCAVNAMLSKSAEIKYDIKVH